MNMGNTYADLKDFAKAEEIFRQVLDGYERSLGIAHKKTKSCARNLNILLEEMERTEEKAALEAIYPESGM
eukprot:CAMPEP_0197547164 /NCGR_PEP_ID=MMETSP1320-20131121/1577_1 /TAXON_ID=91990 /ORGANISM="Bolidomonas sp., Strain RCC2347" /LENGTH=70 /DNA_ID=CAMNT_0043106875 /DNA_START=30 /DNA_END=242 /DNA_ORIENTATION=+